LYFLLFFQQSDGIYTKQSATGFLRKNQIVLFLCLRKNYHSCTFVSIFFPVFQLHFVGLYNFHPSVFANPQYISNNLRKFSICFLSMKA